TTLNARPVLDEVLHSGDEIGIGPFKIVFSVGIPKPITKDQSLVETPKTPAPAAPARTPAKDVQTPVAPATANLSANLSAASLSSRDQQKKNQDRPDRPQIKTKSKVLFSSAREKKTFAPPSDHKDLREFLKPTKGNQVQVIVAWKERILQTYNFKLGSRVKAGFANDQIAVPETFAPKGFVLLDLGSAAKVILPAGAEAQIITPQGVKGFDDCVRTGHIVRSGTEMLARLQQNEVVCVKSASSPVEVFVRYVQGPAAGFFKSPFWFSSGELSAIFFATVMIGLFALYISATTPRELEEQKQDEALKTAQIIFNKPPPLPEQVKTPPQPPPLPPPPIVEKTPPPPTNPQKVAKMDDVTKANQIKGSKQAAAQNSNPKRAAEVAPNKNTNAPKKFTSAKTGGSVKIAENAGANAASAQKDVSKIGLFSALSTSGIRKNIDQAASGAGDILGDADKATGNVGMKENREGDDLGSKFKDVGRGGKGESIQGIADIGTKGRSTGQSIGGTGEGLGTKVSVRVEAGEDEVGWEGKINKEHVRRVVRDGKPQLTDCYNRVLNKMNKSQQRAFSGKIVIGWDIVARGRAENVKVVSSDFDNSEFHSCVMNRIGSFTYPVPPEGLRAGITFPFVFNATQL
ncbi:MAG: AgmX/PglI C-terminal domain-containing protein, partial [Pseudobdellovibrionaceae bacterium]